ncbi:efflux RND transporter permease subunit [bacterium]|nr:efflux RND transporter permease subunit [bacterium]
MSRKENKVIDNSKNNISRFFVENKQLSWVLLIATCLWGIFSYVNMPQRKDPEILVRKAVAVTPWYGANAEKVEQLVTKKVEETIGKNASIKKIESISRDNLSIVFCEIDDNVNDTKLQLDDIALNLQGLDDLPKGAGPVNFIRDFGDTAALMLTVASPKVDDVQLSIKAHEVADAIKRARSNRSTAQSGSPVSIVVCLPSSVSTGVLNDTSAAFAEYARTSGLIASPRLFRGEGFIGLDGFSTRTNKQISDALQYYIHNKLQVSEIHPDAWYPAIIRSPGGTLTALRLVAGDKYSYRQMDDMTDYIERSLKGVKQVSKITRSGVLGEQIGLLYSQERLAAYGVQPSRLPDILNARNITLQGDSLDAGGKRVTIDPSGEFKTEKEIGDVLVPSQNGVPMHLKDIVSVVRGYETPRYLNYFSFKDKDGHWRRTRAITLAVQMKAGQQIGQFGKEVDQKLDEIKAHLPDDIILARTSDQPKQVTEYVSLFMNSLYEAIVLVVLVSLIGFWDWRSALLMALSIPITLFMTFGMMHLLHIDLQQVSIATLIVALGLLVDVPVVAGDAIKRHMAEGRPLSEAAWLGPTKLRKAMIFATLTNVVAYLPFLILSGNVGKFLYSLPVVIACSLIAAFIVSATFIPFLSSYIMKPGRMESPAEFRSKGFGAFYSKLIGRLIDHRWRVLAASMIILLLGIFFLSRLNQQFFPKDLSYLSYVDVWLPEDATFSTTNAAASRAEWIIEKTIAQYAGKEHRQDGILKSLTTFVGGGGPRFWFSVEPVIQQTNYAQIIVEVNDRHDTSKLVDRLQNALTSQMPGARVDVKQLETGKPVGTPVALEISGSDIKTLRSLAEKAKTVLRSTSLSARIRDDWGEPEFAVKLKTDPDRANMSGITNLDIAAASALGMYGYPITTLRQGDKQIPVVARLRMDERSQLSDIENLYVYSLQGTSKVPLRQVSDLSYSLQTPKIRRINQFRTITVACFPTDGHLSSEVMTAIQPKLSEFEHSLPVGYHLHIAGEKAEQDDGFKELVVVLLISAGLIYMSLVVQFRHAVKPFIVFAAIPFGIAGALFVLWLMGAPFGFMAFLGVVSLVGVIVSHIIVLFDFIEEQHDLGKPFRDAVIDAGIQRLRPVVITVAATVIALFPLAMHGGPLWEPMCYAQIGGLTAATFITLLLVPVIFAICVMDLKVVKWVSREDATTEH